MNYLEMSAQERSVELQRLQTEYQKFQDMNLQLDMSRGKPGSMQLDLSEGLLTTVISNHREFAIRTLPTCSPPLYAIMMPNTTVFI